MDLVQEKCIFLMDIQKKPFLLIFDYFNTNVRINSTFIFTHKFAIEINWAATLTDDIFCDLVGNKSIYLTN